MDIHISQKVASLDTMATQGIVHASLDFKNRPIENSLPAIDSS